MHVCIGDYFDFDSIVEGFLHGEEGTKGLNRYLRRFFPSTIFFMMGFNVTLYNISITICIYTYRFFFFF